MVYSVNQSVLDIVKTATVVITPVVYVTTDVMMVGLDQTVTKVRVFFINEHCTFLIKVFNLNYNECITLCQIIMPVSRWHILHVLILHVSKKFKYAIK